MSDESHESSKTTSRSESSWRCWNNPRSKARPPRSICRKQRFDDRCKSPSSPPRFVKLVRDAFSQSLARLQHASNVAVNTLLRVMTDREAPAASRVRAADVVLQATVRGMEVEDIEVRVSELERAAKAARNAHEHGRSQKALR